MSSKKEEKSQETTRQKEMEKNYSEAYRLEISRQGNTVSLIVFLALTALQLFFIFVVDWNGLLSEYADFKTFFIMRITVTGITIALFVMSRLKIFQNKGEIFSTLFLALIVYYGAIFAGMVHNVPQVSNATPLYLLLLYFMSNSRPSLTVILGFLFFPVFFVTNICCGVEWKNSADFWRVVTNALLLNGIGVLINVFLTSLKKKDFINRMILEERNNQTRVDLLVARSVQKSLLGDIPAYIGELKTSLLYEPLYEVSGDFYHIVDLKNDSRAMIIGDVSGHGVSAALITIIVKSIFHDEVKEGLSSAEITKEVNTKALEQLEETGLYLSGVVMKINPGKKTIELTVAGHPSPYFYSQSSGELREIKSSDGLIGVQVQDYHSETITLAKGDRLIIYTDGLTEAKDIRNKEYFENMRKDILGLINSKESTELPSMIYEKVKNFSGDVGLRDDVTVFMIGAN